ncbi:MAG TPA: DnaB-like helicase N-terminal domain-containing protein, partial [Flavobacteriales bacterium]|nr:DnaB-like helicase N-terminal domain-containing protein [Flavobacteriales bacterium]
MEKRPITAVSQKYNLKQAAQSPVILETGKLQPQAVDLEEAVLGAMMLEKNAINDAIDILQPESFYKETHQKIYEAIQQLFSDSQPIDILTVTSKLRTNGFLELVGGPAYIASLTNRVASAANIEYHARIIQQKYIQRELIGIASNTIKDAYEDTADVFDLLDKTESGLYRITQGNIRKDYRKMHELIHEAIDEIEKAKKNVDGVSGVPTGFVELDKITSGWQKSDMVVIAARPGMGKTAFVLSMARNSSVEFNKPVAVFSLEMSAIQLVNRLIAGETELTSDKLRKGN